MADIARRWHGMSLDAATQLVAFDPDVLAFYPDVVVAAAQEGWLRMIEDVLDGVDIERHRETFGNGLIDRIIEASKRLKEKAFVTDDTEN
jgi:hypothetical protein